MTRPKTFDCVAFKRQAQQRLREEHERRKHELRPYCEFLDRKAQEADWARRIEQKFAAVTGS